VRFGDALRSAGMPVTPQRAGVLARALALAPPADRDRLYWTARVSLVADVRQLDTFDRVFAAVFGSGAAPPSDPADRRGDPNAPPAARARPPQPRATPAPESGRAPPRSTPSAGVRQDPADGGPELQALLAFASPEERLSSTAFADLDPDELADVRRLARRLALATPPRRSRRRRPDRRGDRLDLRRTLRRSVRSAGDPVRLASRSRRLRPRRLVLLCDISGSMEPYARVFLQLLQGAVAGGRAEAFVFATRLTRVTAALAGSDVEAALARAGALAPDWSGGTRLAAALGAFVDDHGRRGMARGAVVVILSDGWERDEPEHVGVQMARLGRLAHRIVWVNPRRAAPGFAPLAGGMSAALPHCDAFVSGHSLEALDAVVAAVAEPRRTRRNAI